MYLFRCRHSHLPRRVQSSRGHEHPRPNRLIPLRRFRQLELLPESEQPPLIPNKQHQVFRLLLRVHFLQEAVLAEVVAHGGDQQLPHVLLRRHSFGVCRHLQTLQQQSPAPVPGDAKQYPLLCEHLRQRGPAVDVLITRKRIRAHPHHPILHDTYRTCHSVTSLALANPTFC